MLADEKPKETTISEKAFTLVLPDAWSRRSEDNGSRLVFLSSTGQEQLTVSLLPSSVRMEAAQQLSTFKRILELRRQAETQGLDPSAVKMTDSRISEKSGTYSARYDGGEQASQRRFTCLLFCSPSMVATFYYEALGLPQNQAESHATAILDSVKLVE